MQISTTGPADCGSRQNLKPTNTAGKPLLVVPFSANRKIQRSRSAEDILDENDYSYVLPHEYASQTLNIPSRGQPPGRPPPPNPTKLVPKRFPSHRKHGNAIPGCPKERPNSPRLNGTLKFVEKPVSPTSAKQLSKPCGNTILGCPKERPNSPRLNGTLKFAEKPVSPTSAKQLSKPCGNTIPGCPKERPNSPRLNGTLKFVEKPVSPTSAKQLPKPSEFPPPPKTLLAKNFYLPAQPPIPRSKPRMKPRS